MRIRLAGYVAFFAVFALLMSTPVLAGETTFKYGGYIVSRQA